MRARVSGGIRPMKPPMLARRHPYPLAGSSSSVARTDCAGARPGPPVHAARIRWRPCSSSGAASKGTLRPRWRAHGMELLGGLALGGSTARAIATIGLDAVREPLGGALPRTAEQLARPEVIARLLGVPVRAVRLPGVDFESSNC